MTFTFKCHVEVPQVTFALKFSNLTNRLIRGMLFSVDYTRMGDVPICFTHNLV